MPGRSSPAHLLSHLCLVAQALASCSLVPWRVSNHSRSKRAFAWPYMQLSISWYSERKQEASCLLSQVQVLWEGCEGLRARKFLSLPKETKQCMENKSSWCACLPCPSWFIQTFFPLANISKYNAGSSQSMHLGWDHCGLCTGLYFVQMQKVWDLGKMIGSSRPAWAYK